MLERARVVHRHVCIDFTQSLPDRAEGSRCWLTRSYVHHGAAGEVVLEKRNEKLLRNLVPNSGIFRVLYDAHDLDGRFRTGIDSESDVPPERRAVAEVVLDIALVDDRHAVARRIRLFRIARLVDRVARVEVATEHEGNAHRLEIVRADGVAVWIQVLARLRDVALDSDGAVPLVTLEQADVRERHVHDSWHRGDS